MDAKLTAVGVTAYLEALRTGTPLNINTIKLSSTSITVTGNETTLSNIVYTVPSNKISKYIEDHKLIIKIHLDKTVGTFAIGTFGIYTSDNILFAVCSFPGAGNKIADDLPDTLGNDKTFYLVLQYENISSTLDVTVGDSLSDLLVPVGFPTSGVTVTARQMRTQLATSGSDLSTVNTAILALAITSAAYITWITGSPITKGDATSDAIKTALSYSNLQIDSLFASALTRTP